MRANVGTHITLDTFLAVPNRNINCNTSLFVLGSTLRHGSVWQIGEIADRNIIALHSIYRHLDLADPLWQVLIDLLFWNFDISPSCRYFCLFYHFYALINSCVVHVDDLFALSSIGL